MADPDALLRLTEVVEEISKQLGILTGAKEKAHLGDLVELCAECGNKSGPSSTVYSNGHGLSRNYRSTRAPLPDPRLIRKIIRDRQLRAKYFKGDLFADPVWDILLDLTAALAENKQVSVTSACIASGVPVTTALRWIKHMVDVGLVERNHDSNDRRRTFISLTSFATNCMAQYFADLS